MYNNVTHNEKRNVTIGLGKGKSDSRCDRTVMCNVCSNHEEMLAPSILGCSTIELQIMKSFSCICSTH